MRSIVEPVAKDGIFCDDFIYCCSLAHVLKNGICLHCHRKQSENVNEMILTLDI